MLTEEEKTMIVLRRIRQGHYGAALLNDIDELKRTIADDTQSSAEEGLAFLGLLLRNNFIQMKPDLGFVLTDDPEIRPGLEKKIR